MIYAWLITGILSFGIGFGTAYKIDSATISGLHQAIQASNEQAANTLVGIQDRVTQAQAAAKDANTNLELSHAQSIATINAYHDALKSKRLFDTHRKDGGCTVPTDTNTGIAVSSTDSAELSAGLTDFLLSQALAADQVAVYAQSCWSFVNRNCGIGK
jgi:hypothetical protein